MAETLDTVGYVELTPEQLQTPQGLSELNRMLRTLFVNLPSDIEDVKVFRGYGTPENNVNAQIGSLFLRQDGGSNSTLYIKESGDNTDTGWVGANAKNFKSFSFTSQGVGAGTYYAAGYYEAPSTDANLTQASTTVVLGAANVPYAAHAFIVAGGAGSASGGTGTVEIEVSGTSITDAGVRTTSDTEVIVADITALSLNQFVETAKKWIGQVTYTLQNSSGSTHTTFNVDFNYGFNKYEDFGNLDFVLTDFEVVGLSGANDSSFNIRLLKQDSDNWTYAATGFVSGGTEILNMGTVHSTENDIDNNVPFAFKRASLSTSVSGSASEGLVIEITTGQNNSVQFMAIHVGVRY